MSPTSLQNVLATSAYVMFYEITKQSRDELLARKVTTIHLLREEKRLTIHFTSWIQICMEDANLDPGSKRAEINPGFVGRLN